MRSGSLDEPLRVPENVEPVVTTPFTKTLTTPDLTEPATWVQVFSGTVPLL
jgi:hypothetical protein